MRHVPEPAAATAGVAGAATDEAAIVSGRVDAAAGVDSDHSGNEGVARHSRTPAAAAAAAAAAAGHAMHTIGAAPPGVDGNGWTRVRSFLCDLSLSFRARTHTHTHTTHKCMHICTYVRRDAICVVHWGEREAHACSLPH